MGHMGNWIEFERERHKITEPDKEFRLTLNNGLSTGTLVYNAKHMVMTHTPSLAVAC